MKKNIKQKIAMMLVLALSIFALVGCQNGNTDLVVTVGDNKVYLDEAMVYANSVRYQYESMYGTDIWGVSLGETTLEQQVKQSVIDQLTYLKICNDKAKELGITLTEDEKTEVDDLVKQFIESNEASEAPDKTITTELMTKVYTENYLANHVFEESTKDINTDVSDDEAKQITIQHLLVLTSTQNEDGTTTPFSDEEKAKALEKAEGFLADGKKAEDFKAFAEEKTEDPGGVEYTFGKGEMDPAFEEAAYALKTGEFSGVVETTYGYHILYCVSDFDADATATKKEEIINQKLQEEFGVIYEGWEPNYKVTVNDEVWNTVTFITPTEETSEETSADESATDETTVETTITE